MTSLRRIILLTLVKIIITSRFAPSNTNSKCSMSTRVPRYHIIEPCHRSALGIAARAKYYSLTSCKRLGIEKKALALNFSPNWNRSEPEYPCEVLKCAEVQANINATCVPGIGMFYLIHRKLNYTNAEEECRNMSSTLANVNSEQRTDALAQVLSSAGVANAFVGLKREDETRFIAIDGNRYL